MTRGGFSAIINPMSKLDVMAEELSKRYGAVKRARGCFLYTAKGERLVDLYLEGGRALLGWGGSSSFTMLKNVLSRGLTGSYKTDFSYRVKKAASVLLNSNRQTYYFNSLEKAQKWVSEAFGLKSVVYRPWNFEEINYSEEKAVILVPPFAWAEEIFIVCIAEDLASQEKIMCADSIKLPSCVEEGISRSIYDLIKALQEREEKQFFIYDKALLPYFERKGPYLISKVPEQRYDDFVKHCLDCGIVINPCYDGLSIIPFGADKGVFAKLVKSPFEF